MFTGLVQAVGVISQSVPTPSGRSLWIDPRGWDHRPAPGDSISVCGACLTVAELAPGHASAPSPGPRWRFDVVAETLAKTTLGLRAEGSHVNLEHSLRADSLLGGHFVQGHVDGVGLITMVRDDPADWRVRVRPPAGLMEFMAPKGSITLEGVSLTIAALSEGEVEVALIPTTLAKTTLATWREGDSCNIEADILAKTVIHWMKIYGRRDEPAPRASHA